MNTTQAAIAAIIAEALRAAANNLPPTRHRQKRNDPATLAAASRYLHERADRIAAGLTH